ncbi:uncharacterized protein LOC119355246 [Triticum dicoccoides]|uniref:uncharacterized protein LOC119355246 n=1 Tax=Triticum dicoccoides TaxID=85692 RepID=UPI00188DD735|nr:uncharacterized protein LOC119355246 [Triticum dicoccoides]XP_044326019.1 small polypeptide DEVIL 3-like [Triticum aestivum]
MSLAHDRPEQTESTYRQLDSPDAVRYLCLSEKYKFFELDVRQTEEEQRQRGRLARMLREHRARLYIIRRCVVMLLCHHD